MLEAMHGPGAAPNPTPGPGAPRPGGPGPGAPRPGSGPPDPRRRPPPPGWAPVPTPTTPAPDPTTPAPDPTATAGTRRASGRRADLLISGAGPTAPSGPTPAEAGPSAPDEAGRFQVQGELGRGGMGVVYRARDLQGGRDVALKVLKEALSPQRLIRFQREGQLTARLSHPHIVRIHSMGLLQGKPYLAYELVEGATTLGQAFRVLDPLARVQLVRQACEALGHAHELGIVHRDIKPDNVLVDASGAAHVADFGLAAAQDVERMTVTGVMIGTPSFMPPEQLEARHADVGPHSDVWSLGVLLYQALTGEHPFPAETLYELIDQVTRHDPPRPRSLDPTIPAALEAVCLKALTRDPAGRYPHAGAMAEDLGLALSGERTRAASTSGWRPPHPRRLVAPLAVLLAVVLVLIVVLATSVDPRRVRLEWTHAPPPSWGGDQPLALSGRVQGALEGLALTIGGAVVALDEEGAFSLALNPDPEAEALEVVATRAGEVVWRERYALQVDTRAPELTWPEQLEPFESEQGRISGQVADDGEWVELLFNGEPAGRVAPGTFSLQRALKTGPNPVQVVARDPWGNASPPATRVLWRVPAWWREQEPWPARPRLPLPPGLSFGEQPGQYVNIRDGSLLRWVPPPPADPHRQQRILVDRSVLHLFEDGLFVGQHEVTWAQYARFCQETGRSARRPAFKVGPDHPVHHVTWADAAAYCEWAGLRLPSEVEWELAARGPHGPSFPWGSGSDPADAAQRANVLDEPGHPDGWEYTAPVGSFPRGASPSGCLDMAGNVFEWVQDWYALPPTSEEPLVGYAGPETGTKRVLKGGGFDQALPNCTVGKRHVDEPERALPHTGFRVARSAR